MPDLRNTKRKIRIGLIAMLCLDVAAVALLLSPLIGSTTSRREQMSNLWKDLQQKTRQVEPLRGMDKKVALADDEIHAFYKERLPAEDSEISDQLGKLASQNNVRIMAARYKMGDPDPVGLQPVEIDADCSGDYLQLMRFINSVERNKLFFILDSVSFAGEQNGPGVKLTMKLDTFLKTGSPATSESKAGL
jgi:hypothetical protein